MITNNCFTPEWIQSLRQKYPKTDPLLLEKQIYAFELLGLLSTTGKQFVFKGGTALLLLLPSPKRLSIDIDIVGGFELAMLKKMIIDAQFNNVVEDERTANDIPKRHFKFMYHSSLSKKDDYILLDVLEAEHGYPQLIPRKIQSDLFTVHEDVSVMLPTIDGILGDKLTAFAPHTIGIPFGKRKSMEIIKQLFDLGELFNYIMDISELITSYRAIQRQESRYHVGHPTFEETIHDTLNACYLLSQFGLKNSTMNNETDEFFLGIKQVTSFLLAARFTIDEAKVASAKTALLITIIQLNIQDIHLRKIGFDEKRLIETPVSLQENFTILQKLKKGNPEAWYYWTLVQEMNFKKGEKL